MGSNVFHTNDTTTSTGLNVEFTTPTASLQNYTLRNLEPYTEYLVTLRVFNPAGDGPTSTLAASTDEGGLLLHEFFFFRGY